MQISTEDAALTAILTGIIASGISMFLKQPKYEIIPIYTNKNFLKIKLDCIFSVHLMQYIYKIISNQNKKKRKDISQKTRTFKNKKVEV